VADVTLTDRLAALDIDRAQWRVLTRVLLKNDFAAVIASHGAAAAEAKRARWTLVGMVLVYVVAGVVPLYMIVLSPDVLLAATTMTTVVAFMVGSTLLLGEGVAISSPDDFAILGYRPISSRTYLLARVAALSVRTLTIGLLVGGGSLIALLVKYGVAPAAAGVASVLLTAMATTLAVIALYGWLLRVIGPRSLGRILSYVQLATNFVVWGGFIAVSQGLQEQMVAGLRLEDARLILGYPGCWFASWIALAGGAADAPRLAAAGLSLGTIAVLGWTVAGKLSLDYNERLARLATVSAPPPVARAGGTRWPAFLQREARAVAILVRSHFRDDTRFRIGIVGLLPLTVIYMYLGLREGTPRDPFVAGAEGSDPALLLTFVLYILPFTLYQTLTHSEAYEASWLFHTTPSDRARLVTAGRDAVAVGFLVPYLALLAAVFAYLFGHAGHALLHTLFMGWMAYLVLQITVLADPRLPFSRSPTKVGRGGATFGMIMVGTVAGMIGYAIVTRLVYRSAIAMVVTLVVFFMVSVVLDRRTRVRAVARASELAVG
jgi:hypothetical protein